MRCKDLRNGMKKFKLTNEEKTIVRTLNDSRIPWVFKDYDENLKLDYGDHLLTVETFAMFVADDLLKGRLVGYEHGSLEEFEEFRKVVEVERLDIDAKKYFLNLVNVFEIYKKYTLENNCEM